MLSTSSKIQIQGARTHNLKNIHLDLPRNQLVVITGPSGSGKSSLAFDTLYAEGQRRYVESLSSYVRQFLDTMQKPDVDLIEGLSPAIAIEQKTSSGHRRSTVGTQTQIQDYLRLLFSRVGQPYCPSHQQPLSMMPVSQMVDQLLSEAQGEKLLIMAPIQRLEDTDFVSWTQYWESEGFLRMKMGDSIVELAGLTALDEDPAVSDYAIVVDRLKLSFERVERLSQSIESALALSGGVVHIAKMEDVMPQWIFSSVYACPHCDYKIPDLLPKHFSFNHHEGACSACHGRGTADYFDEDKIVAFPELSLKAGAIVGWDARNADMYQQLVGLSKHYNFDLETAFCDLPQAIRQVILHGSDEERIWFSSVSGTSKPRLKTFEGVIPFYDRQEKNADTEALKNSYLALKTERLCEVCHGARLSEIARHVWIEPLDMPKYTLQDLMDMSLSEVMETLDKMVFQGAKDTIAQPMLDAIKSRLIFLNSVGLSYLSLGRRADTISGGEAQRIRLASQIGSGLSGVMYVLDEPSIGLHQRDNQRLIETLKHLRDLGNSVIVVEHDEDMIRQADYLVDMGPNAGVHGGEVLYCGSVQGLLDQTNDKKISSATGAYLSGQLNLNVGRKRTIKGQPCLSLKGCSGHNLKSLNVDFPIGRLICVTGISGSGKSTLVNETLAPLMLNQLHRAKQVVQPYESIEGVEHFEQAIVIDQGMIGRTPRSNPATYVGIFTPIRELFAQTQDARLRGYDVGRFSFNVKGGRCEACQGDGVMRIDLQFLSDMYVPCDVCHGQRYNRETLEIRYKGKTIADVLNMTVDEAGVFFANIPVVSRKLQFLQEVGLSYLQLGQSATTLSGGEAQRLKLSLELARRSTGRTLYMLDEPTTGLHFKDIDLLMKVLQKLVDLGNTVILIEHQTDVIASADWVIDMGPEGGKNGGYIVAQGTPSQIKRNKKSVTGPFL